MIVLANEWNAYEHTRMCIIMHAARLSRLLNVQMIIIIILIIITECAEWFAVNGTAMCVSMHVFAFRSVLSRSLGIINKHSDMGIIDDDSSHSRD